MQNHIDLNWETFIISFKLYLASHILVVAAFTLIKKINLLKFVISMNKKLRIGSDKEDSNFPEPLTPVQNTILDRWNHQLTIPHSIIFTRNNSQTRANTNELSGENYESYSEGASISTRLIKFPSIQDHENKGLLPINSQHVKLQGRWKTGFHLIWEENELFQWSSYSSAW